MDILLEAVTLIQKENGYGKMAQSLSTHIGPMGLQVTPPMMIVYIFSWMTMDIGMIFIVIQDIMETTCVHWQQVGFCVCSFY